MNDAKLMQNVLQRRFGFSPEGTRLLLDEDATRASILEGMNWLLEQAAAEDVVVVHYSGHGAQIKDATGKRSGGLVSCIVPHDMTWDPPGPISYDEIREWLMRLTQVTPNVTLSFDCDHAVW